MPRSESETLEGSPEATAEVEGPPALVFCVARISIPEWLVALKVARTSRSTPRSIVLYDQPTFAFRCALSACERSPKVVVASLRSLLRVPELQQLEHDSKVAAYPAIWTRALETTTEILLGWLDTSSPGEPVQRALEQSFGRDPVRSFLAKNMGMRSVAPAVLALLLAPVQSRAGSIRFLLPIGWHPDLGDLIVNHTGTELVAPHGWLRRLFVAVGGCRSAVNVTLAFVRALATRGLTRHLPTPDRPTLATEYIEDDQFQGRPRDPDGVVTHGGLDRSKFLLFITRRQRRMLESSDGTGVVTRAKQLGKAHGYAVTILNELPYPWSCARGWARWAPSIVWTLVKHGGTLTGRQVPLWVEDFLDLQSLLVWHEPANVVYPTMPNGRTAFRTNSGVLTSLSRRFGVHSIGIQTRSLYLNKYEDLFDCFDSYLLWGPRYKDRLAPALDLFVSNHEYIGSLNISQQMIEESRGHCAEGATRRLVILGFGSSDYPQGRDFKDAYCHSYAVRFLRLLVEFAATHPATDVQIKLKDRGAVEYYRYDPRVGGCVDRGEPRNVEFLGLDRHDYQKVLGKADVVAAVGFTSPGTDALLLGKPTVFYSLLGKGRCHLDEVPNLVAGTDEDFLALLARAVDDPAGFARAQRSIADGLDSFRDGRAMSRVVTFAERG